MSAQPVYAVVKHDKRWIVTKDGEPVKWSAGDHYPQTHQRKRDAVEYIGKLKVGDAWTALLFAQDATGVYVWTPEEEKQINDYAVVLKVNATRWNFFGQQPAQDIARDQHVKDAEALDKQWIDTKRTHAEKRRVMAARVEAFKRAGVVL